MVNDPTRPALSLQLPGLPLVVHVLKDETITVGRMKENTIVLDSHLVSLVHARITRKDGEFLLKDLNSTNGTWVNGQPIREARLQPGDQVRFADVTGQFDAPAAAPAGEVKRASGLKLARDRADEVPVDVSQEIIPVPGESDSPVSAPAPARSLFWECFLALVVFMVVGVFAWRMAQGTRIGWQHLSDADVPAVVRRLAVDFQGEKPVARIMRQHPWEVGGTAAVALLLAVFAWRLVRVPPPDPGGLVNEIASRRALARIPAANGTAAMWQRRAIKAEQKAERAQTALRSGLASQAAQVFKDKMVTTLLTQRDQLLQAQQCAAVEIAELERRLDEMHLPLQSRLAAYEQRIAELEKALASKTEENQELLQVRIELLRRQLETRRSGSRIEFN
jgi:pSer/pThr/pTyr-binding forkhead associated (FHA) protein